MQRNAICVGTVRESFLLASSSGFKAVVPNKLAPSRKHHSPCRNFPGAIRDLCPLALVCFGALFTAILAVFLHHCDFQKRSSP